MPPGSSPAAVPSSPLAGFRARYVENLAALSAQDRLAYYRAVCDSLGLNPLTRPFEYLNLQGKLVLLNFWATWCPPCRMTMPILEKLAEERKGVVLRPINVGPEEPEKSGAREPES